MKAIVLVLGFLFSLNSSAEIFMNQAKMEEVVKQMAEESQGENGAVEFKLKGMTMYLISDSSNDRMRIMTPVAQYSELTQDQVDKAMQSNFHTALDARYALSKDVLYSAFIHSLSTLDEAQIKSAVTQVYNLSATFGSDYSSGVLSYGGN